MSDVSKCEPAVHSLALWQGWGVGEGQVGWGVLMGGGYRIIHPCLFFAPYTLFSTLLYSQTVSALVTDMLYINNKPLTNSPQWLRALLGKWTLQGKLTHTLTHSQSPRARCKLLCCAVVLCLNATLLQLHSYGYRRVTVMIKTTHNSCFASSSQSEKSIMMTGICLPQSVLLLLKLLISLMSDCLLMRNEMFTSFT